MHERTSKVVSQSDIALQAAFINSIKHLESKPQSYFVITYGCQMNAHDSEKLAGMLEAMGINEAATKEEADFVIYNTCCIRENAQRRALGNVTWLKELRKKKPNLLIGICGCMIQQEGMAQKILKQYKFVDIAFGTHNLYRFPELFYTALESKKQVVEVMKDVDVIDEGLPVKRLSKHHAYITIMYGCNNFCSYCIVPFVRGRERSRDMQVILDEAKELYSSGVQEIMLLGQNVNSYGQSASDFPKLLKALDEIGIPRIRFMTSHPKDLSDELIDVIAKGKHICKQFHLPIQSGSNDILAAMNRRYTREKYLERLEKLRERMPDIGVTTDFIVGFPGETEEQFQDTLSLVEKARFDAAFTFIYSPRVGTKATAMDGQLPDEVTSNRIQRLIKAQDEQIRLVHQSLIGKIENVLVESLSKRGQNSVSGKGERGITIAFPGDESDIGKIIPVEIIDVRTSTLSGKRLDK
jgi:tRNA-N(6)-(isopentenyl)adenosine-37 thiotransferase enzyme MiaB